MTALEQEVISTPQSLQPSVYHYYIRILDNQNKIVVATPKMLEQIPQAAFLNLQEWWHNNDAKYLLKQSIVGIASGHIPYLFQRFYRVDSARAQHTGGTGLGLAIVKSIIDLHQGTIVIESELGKGTTVLLACPG